MFFTFFKSVQMVSNRAKHHRLKTTITTTSTFKYVQNTFRWRLQRHMYVLYAFSIDYVKPGTVPSANSMELKLSYFDLRSTRCYISRKCVSLWICKTVCLLLLSVSLALLCRIFGKEIEHIVYWAFRIGICHWAWANAYCI